MPYTSPVDVMLLLVRDGRVLLARRQNTGYADGQWNLPSGKLEDGEDVVAAIIREAREEIAIELGRGELDMAAALHCRHPDGQARVGFFFHARRWRGEPDNAEPHKCSEIGWFPLDRLPVDTVPYTRAGIELFLRREPFGLHGWPPIAEPAVEWSQR
ncbi:NUDIX hydrolase [Actinophytocola oryzae]|uniref:ADP-ribose pyrophosphatase YjhB (NUDIX family) n=1 Tax=Actinophytocola oryzae TaxID=502181 RepID=A0A4R7W011_9PSEU|nr:NUDIX domain-containing protein [Actinophytocola oryzae]TDV54857.1 ADP-ribose pyrophosphatase YjhB (NUDIX family) [Actinophytocola oryzae]